MSSAERATSQEANEAQWSRWMAAAQDGDRRAYDQLLRAIIPYIRAGARRGGVAPDRADDVVQEVLLTIHRVRHTYDPARPFAPWLQAIITRRSIDGRRRWGREKAREVHVPDYMMDHPDPAPPATEGLERQDDKVRIEHAVAGLPPGQQQAVRLLALEEKSLAEAAVLTGRKTGALKVNLHRALKTLRERLSLGQ